MKADPTFRRTQVQNLFLHAPSGVYYARAKVKGKSVRRSLRTTIYNVAKDRLAAKLEQIGKQVRSADSALKTFADCVRVLRANVSADPSIKPTTRESYLFNLEALGKGAVLPTKLLAEITPADMVEWWGVVGAKYAPQQANHLLWWVKKSIEMARSAGVMQRDPMVGLKRIRIQRKSRGVLTPDQFKAVISVIRDSDQWQADACADWLEFAAYSGMRPGEMLGLKWEHIDERAGIIWVHEGKTVARTGKVRPVPIMGGMRKLLKTLDRDNAYVFQRREAPRNTALRRACKKLGFPHQRVYDLRHLFATNAIKNGVDVPTVSLWMGHSDGGGLVMRTYTHPDQKHSMEQAKRVKW